MLRLIQTDSTPASAGRRADLESRQGDRRRAVVKRLRCLRPDSLGRRDRSTHNDPAELGRRERDFKPASVAVQRDRNQGTALVEVKGEISTAVDHVFSNIVKHINRVRSAHHIIRCTFDTTECLADRFTIRGQAEFSEEPVDMLTSFAMS
jgi:hypothetical protein